MKIIQIIPLLGTGGAEKFTIDLSNELARLGHEVILATLFDKSEISTLEEYVDAEKVKRVSLHKKQGFDLTCFYSILDLIKKEKPEVVHGHVGAIKYMMLAATFYRKCKYVATIHSEARREAGTGIELYSRLYMFKLGFVIPVTISPESENSFKQFYGFGGNMIPNGCSSYNHNTINLQRQHSDFDFLFVHAGRLQKVKNQITLVKAFKKLLNEGVKAKLLLMGRKEDADVYENIRPYFGDRIKYLGEQKDCRSFMASADAFCLTSSMEGMPITIIEAFSVGCVPIVTPVGGCVNLVQDGVNGVVAKGIGEEQYYDALKRYISLSCDARMTMKNNAIETFDREYSITTSARKYVELYKR